MSNRTDPSQHSKVIQLPASHNDDRVTRDPRALDVSHEPGFQSYG